MTAKNKDDFLFQLHTELHRIGVENNEDIFADFEEHFRASAEQGLTEEETCEKLGDVKEIARSYIDIESTRINSILANAIEDSRPHVSLKKPGRSVPASSVKNGDNTQQENAPVAEEAPNTEIITEQPAPIREYTPEHIAMEPAPSSAPVSTPKVNIEKPVQSDLPIQESETAQSVREFTPEHTTSEPAPQSERVSTATAPAQNTQNNTDKVDPHVAEIPPQCGEQVGSGNGFRWSDLKGKETNTDIGKLVMWLCLDVFIFSWALPALASVICAFFVTVVFGIFGAAIATITSPSAFHLLSRIFLAGGLFSLAVLLFLLGIKMVGGFIKIIKNIVIAHVKAIYGL